MKFLTAALFSLYVAVAWSHVLVEQENDRLKDRIAYLEAEKPPSPGARQGGGAGVKGPGDGGKIIPPPAKDKTATPRP